MNTLSIGSTNDWTPHLDQEKVADQPGGTVNRGSSVLGADNHTQLSVPMSSEVGKGLALSLRAAGHVTRDPTQMAGGYDSNNGKGYTSKEDIAALMGFAGVYSKSNLPDIWEVFKSTKGKNIDAYQRHIYSRMKQYAYDQHIQIDTSVYLEQETIKAIIELRFNPREGVAHLSLASKGLSILACRARTMQETERVREQEQALSMTEKKHAFWMTCSSYQKGQHGHWPTIFQEVKMNVSAFMALVWVLFGLHCDYYKNYDRFTKPLSSRMFMP